MVCMADALTPEGAVREAEQILRSTREQQRVTPPFSNEDPRQNAGLVLLRQRLHPEEVPIGMPPLPPLSGDTEAAPLETQTRDDAVSAELRLRWEMLRVLQAEGNAGGTGRHISSSWQMARLSREQTVEAGSKRGLIRVAETIEDEMYERLPEVIRVLGTGQHSYSVDHGDRYTFSATASDGSESVTLIHNAGHRTLRAHLEQHLGDGTVRNISLHIGPAMGKYLDFVGPHGYFTLRVEDVSPRRVSQSVHELMRRPPLFRLSSRIHDPHETQRILHSVQGTLQRLVQPPRKLGTSRS